MLQRDVPKGSVIPRVFTCLNPNLK